MPVSGLTGWGAAQKHLDRCKDDDRKALLTALVKLAGVQGAPALEYVTRLMRYYVDEADFPSQSAKLRQVEIDYIERRSKELLRPFVDGNDRRLAEKIRGFTKAAA
jgi:hypothetical protein